MNSKLHLFTHYTMDSPSQMELMRKHRQKGCEVEGGVVEYQGTRHLSELIKKERIQKKTTPKNKGFRLPNLQ